MIPPPTPTRRPTTTSSSSAPGPPGLTAAYMLTKRGRRVDGARGRHRRRRDQPHRRARRLALRHRRPPLLHQGEAGRRPVVRDPRQGRVPPPPAHEPHLLPREVLRLPDQAVQRAEEPRAGRGGALRVLVPLGAGRPPKDQSTLEGYIVANYGWRLYNHFFKTYNEKVWGVPASEIRPTGARSASRTCRCSRRCGSRSAPKVAGGRDKSKQVTSLIEEFNYPKYGPGQMWERCTELVTEQGTKVVFDSLVTKIEHADGRAIAVTADERRRHQPLRVHRRDLVDADQRAARGDGPAGARRRCSKAAEALRYRDFITVALVVPEEYGFPDNWIYIHDPDVEGRPHPELRLVVALPREGRPHLPRARVLRERGRRDVDEVRRRPRRAGQARARSTSAWSTRRRSRPATSCARPKAYPFYDGEYKAERRDRCATWLEEHTPNVYPVGRNGMHRYNNQDHSMYTAMLSRREHLRRRPRRLVGERRRGVPRGSRGATSRSPHRG